MLKIAKRNHLPLANGGGLVRDIGEDSSVGKMSMLPVTLQPEVG
jgi:hypothetical protein